LPIGSHRRVIRALHSTCPRARFLIGAAVLYGLSRPPRAELWHLITDRKVEGEPPSPPADQRWSGDSFGLLLRHWQRLPERHWTALISSAHCRGDVSCSLHRISPSMTSDLSCYLDAPLPLIRALVSIDVHFSFAERMGPEWAFDRLLVAVINNLQISLSASFQWEPRPVARDRQRQLDLLRLLYPKHRSNSLFGLAQSREAVEQRTSSLPAFRWLPYHKGRDRRRFRAADSSQTSPAPASLALQSTSSPGVVTENPSLTGRLWIRKGGHPPSSLRKRAASLRARIAARPLPYGMLQSGQINPCPWDSRVKTCAVSLSFQSMAKPLCSSRESSVGPIGFAGYEDW
jgi:hypothetical protein